MSFNVESTETASPVGVETRRKTGVGVVVQVHRVSEVRYRRWKARGGWLIAAGVACWLAPAVPWALGLFEDGHFVDPTAALLRLEPGTLLGLVEQHRIPLLAGAFFVTLGLLLPFYASGDIGMVLTRGSEGIRLEHGDASVELPWSRVKAVQGAWKPAGKGRRWLWLRVVGTDGEVIPISDALEDFHEITADLARRFDVGKSR